MGNAFPPLSASTLEDSTLRKSRLLRDYRRSTSLITSCISSGDSQRPTENGVHQRYFSLSRARSLAPTDADVIDVYATLPTEAKRRLIQQLDYIQSCVRKDKGLFGNEKRQRRRFRHVSREQVS
jgi:hypothetical protein